MSYLFKLAKCTRLLNKRNAHRLHAHGLTLNNLQKENIGELLLQKDEFQIRHIGPRQYEQLEMLETIGFKVVF